jgi:tetratricopeptide (TPR) repeat protein
MVKMVVDLEQFLADCKTNGVEFEPNFLNFLTKIDSECTKIKEVYFKYAEIIELDGLYEKDIEILSNYLREIEQIFIRLRSLIESRVEEFTLLEEIGKEFKKIFVKVDYVSKLEYMGLHVAGGQEKDFIALDLENLQEAIEILQSTIQFQSKNESHPHLPDTALEIEGFYKMLGSLNHQFLPNVILLKLPPRLLQLYNFIEKITKRIQMFSSCVAHDYLSSYISDAIKSYNKIQKKSRSENKDAVKIRGSSGLKMSFISLLDLASTIKFHFLPLF